MDVTKVQAVMERESLPDAFDFLIQVGEIPYRANRRAIVEFHLKRNPKMGLQKVRETIKGLNGFIGELELFRDASREIAEEANSVLRPS